MKRIAKFILPLTFLSFLVLSVLPHEHSLVKEDGHHHELSVEHEQCLLCTVHITDNFVSEVPLRLEAPLVSLSFLSILEEAKISSTLLFTSDRGPPSLA